MIARYTRPEIGRIWSDENKFRMWLEVEIATAEVEAEAGLIPKSAAGAIRRKSRFSVEQILEIEKQVKHDVIAFTTNVAQNIGPGAATFTTALPPTTSWTRRKLSRSARPRDCCSPAWAISVMC